MAKSMLRQGVQKMRSLRPRHIRKEALRPFALELLAGDAGERERLLRVLIPDSLAGEPRARALGHILSASPSAGVAHAARPLLRVRTPHARHQGPAAVVDLTDPAPGLHQLLTLFPEYRLALGRAFPVLRDLLAPRLIQAVAGRNAAVAAVSAIPEVVPNPLSLVLALGEMGSDTVIITVNQIALGFELAALHGHDVGWRQQSGMVAGLIAGGLGWRTLARELVGLLPAGFGLAAKSVLAYSGTVAVGNALWRVSALPPAPTLPQMDISSTQRPLARRRQTA